MPARKINFTAGQVDNSKSHGNYLSQHSDREYETLLKAFLLLGERYDELQEDYDDLAVERDNWISDYEDMAFDYHKLWMNIHGVEETK